MRKIGFFAVLVLLLALMRVPRTAAQQFYYMPLFYWPLPDEYRIVTAYPDHPFTWQFLGLVTGKGCPGYLNRDYEPSKPYWLDGSLPEDQDWQQASQGRRKVACYRTHAGTDIFADPGTPVYAVAEGEITVVDLRPNEDNELNGYVEIDHAREFRGVIYTWQTRYLHLKPDQLVVTPGPVREGQLLGYVANRGTNTHLHIEFDDLWDDCLDPCVTNPWGRDVLWIDYDDDARIDLATSALEAPRPFTNLVANPHFDGLTGWAASPGAQIALQDGALLFSRAPDAGLAWIKQPLPYAFAPETPVQVKVTLGNTSAATKYVGLTLRSSTTWIGALSCVFALPPHSPPGIYTVEGVVPAEWNNALLHLAVTPADGEPGVRIDEAWVAYDAGVIPGPVRCIAP